MSRIVTALPLVVLFGLVVYFAIGLTGNPQTLRSVLIDKPVPAFNLPSFGRNGETVTQDALKGRVTLLNVFASWCVACRAEHGVLLRLSRQGRVAVYGLAWKDKPDELRQFLDELGNPYTAIADDAAGRTAIDLGVTGAPETFVIDARGRIRYKQVGPIDDYRVARDAQWQRPVSDAADRALSALARALHGWTVQPGGTEGYAKAEVTAGGVDTRDLSSRSMESTQPGLYFIGEVVDVTGWLGGYNFQWAWASAHACATALRGATPTPAAGA